MSNSLVRNPVFLDQMAGDISISTGSITVYKIRIKTAADGDIFVLEDRNGNHVVWMQTAGNGDPIEINFPEGFTFDGLQLDADDGNSGLDNDTDFCWIYLG